MPSLSELSTCYYFIILDMTKNAKYNWTNRFSNVYCHVFYTLDVIHPWVRCPSACARDYLSIVGYNICRPEQDAVTLTRR